MRLNFRPYVAKCQMTSTAIGNASVSSTPRTRCQGRAEGAAGAGAVGARGGASAAATLTGVMSAVALNARARSRLPGEIVDEPGIEEAGEIGQLLDLLELQHVRRV